VSEVQVVQAWLTLAKAYEQGDDWLRRALVTSALRFVEARVNRRRPNEGGDQR
jgi:hypothetical protein